MTEGPSIMIVFNIVADMLAILIAREKEVVKLEDLSLIWLREGYLSSNMLMIISFSWRTIWKIQPI